MGQCHWNFERNRQAKRDASKLGYCSMFSQCVFSFVEGDCLSRRLCCGCCHQSTDDLPPMMRFCVQLLLKRGATTPSSQNPWKKNKAQGKRVADESMQTKVFNQNCGYVAPTSPVSLWSTTTGSSNADSEKLRQGLQRIHAEQNAAWWACAEITEK